jgi:hypothetical protein
MQLGLLLLLSTCTNTTDKQGVVAINSCSGNVDCAP